MTDMVCCPLDNWDGDGPRASSEVIRTARKPHRCVECHETIPVGTKYEYASGIWEEPMSFKTCLSCVEIRNHFACTSGWTYGEVWNQLEENFFEDMKAGGSCMKGLSPEAKARLFEKRMTWYEENNS